jgi:hypothetical protein
MCWLIYVKQKMIFLMERRIELKIRMTMKTIVTAMIVAMMALAPAAVNALPFDLNTEKDTVVIELENGSRIIIYTKDRAELKKIQAYDINEMIRDLNQSLTDDKVEYLEIQSEDGKKYLIDSPNVIIGKGESSGDTVIIDQKALDKIRIRVGGLELSVDPDNFDADDFDEDLELKKYTYVQEETDRTRHYFNFDIGTNNWMENGKLPSENNEPYSVKPWGSWYVGMNWLNRTWVGGPVFIEWGGGVSWYNWKMEDASFQAVKGVNEVEFTNNLPVDATPMKSKLSATYINASFVPMFDFGKGARKVSATKGDGFTFKTSRKSGFRVGAGVYAGYRIGSKSKYTFKENNNRERNKDSDHFYLENFRYGVRGQLGFGSFDMFVLYDLNETFVSGKGPGGANLNAFTIGVTL